MGLLVVTTIGARLTPLGSSFGSAICGQLVGQVATRREVGDAPLHVLDRDGAPLDLSLGAFPPPRHESRLEVAPAPLLGAEMGIEQRRRLRLGAPASDLVALAIRTWIWSWGSPAREER